MGLQRLSPTILSIVLALTGCSDLAPEHQIVAGTGAEIRIAMEELRNGRVHFYTLKMNEKNVNFFVRRDGTGNLQAHFDACYNCYRYKLGYVHKDNQVVCLACKIAYDLDQVVWDYVGPCVPISLPSESKQDTLVIPRRRLEKGEKYF